MQDFKKKIVSGFAWEGGTKLFVQIFSWIGTVIVARLLTPEDYGLVAVSGVFIGLIAIVSDMGLSAGLINSKKELSRNELGGVFWFSLLLGITLAVLLIVFAPLIEVLFDMSGLSSVIMATSSVLVLSSLKCVPSSIVLREMNYKFRALVDMFGQFSQIASVVSLAYLGYGAWSLVIGAIVMHVVTTIPYLSILVKKVSLSLTVNWREIVSIIQFGSKVMASRIVGYFTSASPTFLSGLIAGQKETGQFSLAGQIAQVPLDKVGVIFNRIIFPAISRIKEDVRYSKVVYFKLHRVLLTISVPLLVGVALVSEDLVLVLFTSKWKEITPLLQLICMINVVRVSAMIIPPVLEGLGKPGIVFRYNLLSVCLIPLASVVGLQWGVVGMITSWFVVFPITYWYVIKKLSVLLSFSLYEYFGSFKSVVLASILMSLVLFAEYYLLSEWMSLVRLIIMVVSGALVYAFTFLLFFRSEVDEIKEALSK